MRHRGGAPGGGAQGRRDRAGARPPGAAPGGGGLNGGAYLLRLRLAASAHLQIGRLGALRLAPGEYLYVGSARRGLAGRIARHRRLCLEKGPVRRWHLDHVLAHPACRWLGAAAFPGGVECALLQGLLAHPRVQVPLPGMGASDCAHGCPAHFLALSPSD